LKNANSTPGSRANFGRTSVILITSAIGCALITFVIWYFKAPPTVDQQAVTPQTVTSSVETPSEPKVEPVRSLKQPEPAGVPAARVNVNTSEILEDPRIGVADVGVGRSVATPTSPDELKDIDALIESVFPVAPVPMPRDPSAASIVKTPVAYVDGDPIEKRNPQWGRKVMPAGVSLDEQKAALATAKGGFCVTEVVSPENTTLVAAGVPFIEIRLRDRTPISGPSLLFASNETQNELLRATVTTWMNEALAGQRLTLVSSALSQPINSSAFTWQSLYELGRIVMFIDGSELAQPFFRAALDRAKQTGSGVGFSRDDLAKLELVSGAFIWIYKDYAVAEEAVKLMIDRAEQSASMGRAGVLYADLLEREGRGDSGDAIVPLRKALELAVKPQERCEIQWTLGTVLFRAQKFQESIDVFTTLVEENIAGKAPDSLGEPACKLLIFATLRSGDSAKADGIYDQWAKSYKSRLSEQVKQDVRRAMESVKVQ
jgi:hypothetical protein